MLVSAEELQRRVAELGEEISRDYAGRPLLLVGVLKGAVFFLSDLMRYIDIPVEVDFMAVASYGSATDSSGVVRILKDLDAAIEGRDVLIVEDIVDSGLTLQYLLRNLGSRNPRSLEVCALLTKPERRKVDLPDAATSASRSRTGSSSATASTTPSGTATCPSWRCWSRPEDQLTSGPPGALQAQEIGACRGSARGLVATTFGRRPDTSGTSP